MKRIRLLLHVRLTRFLGRPIWSLSRIPEGSVINDVTLHFDP